MTITRNITSLENFKSSLLNLNADLDDSVLGKCEDVYNRAIAMMERYIPENTESRNIQVSFGEFYDTGGHQLIAEGAVSDLGRPVQNQYNWHLQNTSQWLFAFGLVFDKERKEFSLHT